MRNGGRFAEARITGATLRAPTSHELHTNCQKVTAHVESVSQNDTITRTSRPGELAAVTKTHHLLISVFIPIRKGRGQFATPLVNSAGHMYSYLAYLMYQR